MLNNILKKYHIIVIPFFFAVAGYFYNKYSEDDWFYRYEVRKSFPAIIYLDTLDEEMYNLISSNRIKDINDPRYSNQNFLQTFGVK